MEGTAHHTPATSDEFSPRARSAPPPEVLETHSAWVVLLGDRAYKLKKPVQLDVLDFSTREARELAVRHELALNRRLAPDVYLGVADVAGTDGAPCDHVLVMRRMPAERRLSALVVRGAPVDDELRDVARTIAAFHATSETSPAIAAVGSPDVIRGKVDRDLREMRSFAPELLDVDVLDDVTYLTHRYLAGRGALLEARVAHGFVRDGHGDLLADDIFCLDDGPRILDCIEFDDTLRYGDVLADVAFLAMDLERLGAPDLATRLLAWYVEFSGEHHPESLRRYYVATRALIRSKVTCVRAIQGDPDAAVVAPKLLALAHDHLRRARIRLVLVGGPPGTGKSTLASLLADTLACVLLRSDEVRKDVTGVGRATSRRAGLDEGIYTPAATRVTYEELLERARRVMSLGETVVIDASWSDAEWRSTAHRLAADASADVTEFRCDVPPDIAAARIVTRMNEGDDVSDADPDVAAAVRRAFDAWPSAHVLSTLPPPDAVARAALAVVDAR